jgi:hypothetical protein
MNNDAAADASNDVGPFEYGWLESMLSSRDGGR